MAILSIGNAFYLVIEEVIQRGKEFPCIEHAGVHIWECFIRIRYRCQSICCNIGFMVVNNHQITNVISVDSTVAVWSSLCPSCRVFIIPIISPVYIDIDTRGMFVINNVTTDLWWQILDVLLYLQLRQLLIFYILVQSRYRKALHETIKTALTRTSVQYFAKGR